MGWGVDGLMWCERVWDVNVSIVNFRVDCCLWGRGNSFVVVL